jgi:hypothetical protein
MKKFSAILLTLCMSYVLVGCDSGSTPAKKDPTTPPATKAPDAKKTP